MVTELRMSFSLKGNFMLLVLEYYIIFSKINDVAPYIKTTIFVLKEVIIYFNYLRSFK